MATSYFQGFNYSLANEDVQIEKHLSRDFRSIAAVCGSGIRALGLLRSDLDKITIFDISQTQLEYAQLHFLAIKTLSYSEYLIFFGFQPSDLTIRTRLFHRLQEAKINNNFLNKINYSMIERGLIYSGRWESFIIFIAKTIRFFLDYDFETQVYEQNSKPVWPKEKLRRLLKVIAHPKILNHFLYRGHMPKGHDMPLHEFLFNGIESILHSPRLKSSFLHQLFFLGSLKYKEGIDALIDEQQFNIIKNYVGEVEFKKLNILEVFKNVHAEFYSLSDVVSYLAPSQIESLASEITSSSYRRIVIRTFMKHPELGKVLSKNRNAGLEQWATEEDLTRLYRFQIYDKN